MRKAPEKEIVRLFYFISLPLRPSHHIRIDDRKRRNK